MRVLRFIVTGQIIKQDPDCDFSGLVPGTEGYLKAEFRFSQEWSGLTKVAAFYGSNRKEYPPQLLEDGISCIIPTEALKKYAFKISLIGKGPGIKLVTNKVAVTQDGEEL